MYLKIIISWIWPGKRIDSDNEFDMYKELDMNGQGIWREQGIWHEQEICHGKRIDMNKDGQGIDIQILIASESDYWQNRTWPLNKVKGPSFN